MIVETKNGKEEVTATDEIKQVPEGKVLERIELLCDKHGDITRGSLFLSYTTKSIDNEVIQKQNFFCVQCLADMYEHFQNEGIISKLTMKQVLRDETEEDKKAREEGFTAKVVTAEDTTE